MSAKETLLFPSYLPSIASFSVMTQYEVFWEVCGNYQKQSLRNRAYIANDRGLHALTIPVQGKAKEQSRRSYDEILIDNSQPWQRTHWRTLQTAYRTSPYFEFYEHLLAPLYSSTYTHLLVFNLALIKTICNCLQIPFSENNTTVYEKYPADKKDHRALVSPKPSTTYQGPVYNQVFIDRHDFIANLSILDLLFNEGPHSISLLKAAAI